MSMATPEPSSDLIDSLPLIDLRLLSQSELYALSLVGANPNLRRSDDDSVVPKIDRSVFNESAGSRKQTFSRLRLHKHNSPVRSSSLRIPVPIHDTEDEENAQIIALLQQLFGVESLRITQPLVLDGVDDRALVPVQVEFSQQPLEPQALMQVPIDVLEGSQRKRKRGRPRKNENLDEEEPKSATSNGVVTRSEKEEQNRVQTVAMVNDKGFVVEAAGLGCSVDPFEEELKRRTQGLETESQLWEYLETLNGEWMSQRKKRRIVPASDLGDSLPKGWNIVLCVLRRAGRASVVCRRYVSPDGRQFESCKEASAFLLSLLGVQDISHLKSSYTDGSLVSSSNRSQSVGLVTPGDMKTNANASNLCLSGVSVHSNHEKQATVSSSIGSETFKGDLALGFKLGDTTGEAFRDFSHQTRDEQLTKGDKNDRNSVQDRSSVEDKDCNVRSEKLVGAIEASDSACNLYIPLVFSNNNNNGGQFSDKTNTQECIKGGSSNFADLDKSTGCHETVTCGNKQEHVDNNGHGLSVKLVEENIQKIGFESRMLAPNSEGKVFTGKNLEDRHPISSLEDMETNLEDRHPISSLEDMKTNLEDRHPISSLEDMETNLEDRHPISFLEDVETNLEDRHPISSPEDMETGDGKPIKADKQQIIRSRVQPEIEDVSTNIKLQSSSEACPNVPFSDEPTKHTSTNSMDRTQTSMLKDSAEENFFDSDLFSSSIDERTSVRSSYINNVQFSSCTLDVSESGGVDFASDLKMTENVSCNHIPHKEAGTSCLQEKNSFNGQNRTTEDLLPRSSESNLFGITGNQQASAFQDNVNIISSGIFDALKAVDADCMKSQLGMVSCGNVVTEDAYTTASIMQEKPQGCVSVPLGGSIINQFEKQSGDGVHKANKSCLPEEAKNEVEIFQTDSMGLPKFW